MKTVEKQLEALFKKTVKLFQPDFNEWDKLFIQPASNSKFGDYQTNFAMTTAKIFRKAPRMIAEDLVSNFPENSTVEKLEVAGPGFINIFLKESFLDQELKKIGVEEYEFSEINTEKDVVIDYSSPNIAKRFHIGHLRTTVIGDSIKRILQFLGHNVIADNHLGDWGTQFGKLIVGYRNWLDRKAYEKDPIKELERIYVEFGNRVSEENSLEELARLELKKVQSGDEENKKLWKEFVELSLNDYKKTYKRLNIDFDTWYGESFYHEKMPGILELLKEKDIAKMDDGALVVFFDEEDNLHPCIVQKKDGAFLYSTSDLATVNFKRETYKMGTAVYVTDDRQQAHFKQIFKISEKLGWAMDFEHVVFGLMTYEGKVISSRTGASDLNLENLLNEAEKRSLEVIEEKNPSLPEEEKKEIAKIIGIGAIKYNDLSQNRVSTVDFSWNKALSFEGNTAPYLQYSYARIQSIKRKAAEQNIVCNHDAPIVLKSELEKSLAALTLRFPEIVIKAAESYRPNLVADYLFELAQKFSSFYNAMPILKEEGEILNSRLMLIDKTAITLKRGLDLLGIKTIDRM